MIVQPENPMPENPFQRIRSLGRQNAAKEALELIAQEESRGVLLPPDVLVLKARLIQIDDEKCIFELADAEKALKDAITADSDCVQALLELGWFELCVNDEPHRAFAHFEAAIKVMHSEYTEALDGVSKCLRDFSGWERGEGDDPLKRARSPRKEVEE